MNYLSCFIDMYNSEEKIVIQNPDAVIETLLETHTEAQIIVHCHFYASHIGDRYRIWKSTYLIDIKTQAKSKLLHAENVPFNPEWKIAQSVGWHSFTLVFEPLPKNCKSFDLIEQIPESGAFYVPNIMRNYNDVYNVEL